MPNGKPGDHPLTDILIHNLRVYGREADNLIRKIEALSGQRELHEWWGREIGWDRKRSDVLARARKKYAELVKRAEENGWKGENK